MDRRDNNRDIYRMLLGVIEGDGTCSILGVHKRLSGKDNALDVY